MKKLALVMLLLLAACQSQESQAQGEAAQPAPKAPAAKPASPSTAPSTAPSPAPVAKPAAVPAPKPLLGEDPNAVVANINGLEVTEADLLKEIEPSLGKIKAQLYKLKQRAIQNMIEQKLLEAEAQKQGKSLAQLLQAEVQSKVVEVTEEEAKAFYEKNKRRFQGKDYDKVAGAIKRQMANQQARTFRANFMDRLKAGAKLQVFLEPPRVEVSADDDPSQGPAEAPVTIIEFTDYQCPFCSRVRPTLKKIRDIYGDKVRYVLRDFPLSFHKEADKAAQAATCAGDQGKYWDYSDILWKNQRALGESKLKEYSKQIQLDQAKFEECLDSNRYAAEVRKDMSDGSRVGVTGTPAFFINGQNLSGAQPFEAFKEVIDAELLLLNKSKN